MKIYHRNPRSITGRQIKELEESLIKLGDLSGIVHDLNSDEIIGGNQRSRIFNINECEVIITDKWDEPDDQGTVAFGFVVWQNKRYAYRQVRWTPELCAEANIRANKAGGGFDFDMLANEFEADDLLSWGFTEFELGLEPGTSSAPEEPGEEPIPIYTGSDPNFKPADALKPNDYSPHAMTEREYSRLLTSIKTVGILNPLLIRPTETLGEYEIVDGNQRWKAAKQLGLKIVPVVIREMDDTQARAASIASNELQGMAVITKKAQTMKAVSDKNGEDWLIRATGLNPEYVKVGMKHALEESTAGYGVQTDEDGVTQRQLREYLPGEYEEIGQTVLLILTMTRNDFDFVTETLKLAGGDQVTALIGILNDWRKVNA